ncbi:MAG: D-aminoacyl-tRNA deacylase [Candidatus Micrarchaeota archaeon]
MILLFTSNNEASKNIAMKLVEEQGFEPDGEDKWRRGPHILLETRAKSVLEVPTDFETECIIVLSTHKSKIKEKVMTAHYPGNWDRADMGGEARTLNMADAGRLKLILREMKKEADAIGWRCGLEADHHGPTGKVPIIFAEIGSTEEEWKDKKAASAMARALSRGIEADGRFDCFLAFGGGHYPRPFEKEAFEGELAVSHIAPKYAIDSIDEGMFAQAVGKNVGKVVKVLMLKDETNAAQKDKVRGFAEKFGLKFELI